ncbi:MAG: DUF3604 domain-containing protein, partial [Myxococcota bacterium]
MHYSTASTAGACAAFIATVSLFGLAYSQTPGLDTPSPPSDSTARATAPSGQPYSEDREACADRDPLRRPFWGELHVHSELSMDAWLWDVRGTADEVYGFARGKPLGLAPYKDGQALRTTRLERPLDFAALTDHASYQGEVYLCTHKGSSKYDAAGCKVYRGEIPPSESAMGEFAARMASVSSAIDSQNLVPARNTDLCGENGETCKDAMALVWREQQEAAERNYDRSSACRFTTFKGYEYTATPGLAKVHHNVIFRNDKVPDAPIAWVDHPDVYDLWRLLKQECLQAGTGCDVLTLPHNSNLSNGRMFTVPKRDLPL